MELGLGRAKVSNGSSRHRVLISPGNDRLQTFTLPGQLGEWCEHAHAYLTCWFFRADGDDLQHFRCGWAGHYVATESFQQEALIYEEGGQTRIADIMRKRLQRNKDAGRNTDNIICSIEEWGLYKGGSRYSGRILLERKRQL